MPVFFIYSWQDRFTKDEKWWEQNKALGRIPQAGRLKMSRGPVGNHMGTLIGVNMIKTEASEASTVITNVLQQMLLHDEWAWRYERKELERSVLNDERSI